MITRLFLVRHGETDWNKLGKFQGSTDIELNEAGLKQAEYVAQKLINKFDAIYSSPLKRAYKTAETIAKSKDIKPLICPGITEINFGDWEGLTVSEIEQNFPKEFAFWKKDTVEGPICGGDKSIKLACERAKASIMDIVNSNLGKDIVVVAHGGIIKAALIAIFSWDISMYHKIFLGNTSISEIYFTDELKPVIVTINDTHHLKLDSN